MPVEKILTVCLSSYKDWLLPSSNITVQPPRMPAKYIVGHYGDSVEDLDKVTSAVQDALNAEPYAIFYQVKNGIATPCPDMELGGGMDEW